MNYIALLSKSKNQFCLMSSLYEVQNGVYSMKHHHKLTSNNTRP